MVSLVTSDEKEGEHRQLQSSYLEQGAPAGSWLCIMSFSDLFPDGKVFSSPVFLPAYRTVLCSSLLTLQVFHSDVGFSVIESSVYWDSGVPSLHFHLSQQDY